MEKKMYNKPEVEIIAVEPSSIICASVTEGPDTGEDIVVGN